MYYKCLRCGKKKELRRGSKTGNNAASYLADEKRLEQSKIVHLHKHTGQRNLCPGCLSELVRWQEPRAGMA